LNLKWSFLIRLSASSAALCYAIGTAGGTLIDSYTIGVPPDPVVPSGGDTWSLPVQRGTTLQLTTRTPRPPGLLQNPVDPLIQLLDHTGTVVASDSSSAFDGKNAKLIYRIPGTPQSPGETLPWTVRVLNETNSAGEYEIRVAEPTLNAYLAWAALQPAGFPPDIASDPDLDGLPNLMEYLMDSNPALASAPLVPTLTLRSGSPSTLQLNLPSAWTRPVAALLQTSAQLTGGTWTTLATKSAGQTYWLSSAPDQLPPSPAGAFTLPPAPGNRQFYRMAFVLE
jgi:hypothetical protein